MPVEQKLIAALLTALATAVAALASSGLGRLAPSIRREQVLSFESKRLAVIETLLRIRSQYTSDESTKNDLDKILGPLLESSLRALADTGDAKGTNAVRFFQEWLLLRKPAHTLLWPMHVAFYAAFVISFVVLQEMGVTPTFILMAAMAAMFRLVIGLIERIREAVPKP